MPANTSRDNNKFTLVTFRVALVLFLYFRE